MANRSPVPKFGNWETEQNVPYTAYFDKARKGRSGAKMINPNDPQENPEMFPEDPSNARAPPPKSKPEPNEPIGRGPGRTREEGAMRQFSDPPARNANASRGTAGNDQRVGGRGAGPGDGPRRPAGRSIGSEQNVDRSPLHPHARVYGRGAGTSPSVEGKNNSYDSSHGTPMRSKVEGKNNSYDSSHGTPVRSRVEGKNNSYDSSHGTPVRSRMRPSARGDESPDKGAAVPKFGEWDENNPASADGYTHIFNKVREERQSGGGRVPDMASDPSYSHVRRPPANGTSKICCFPWGGK